MRVVSELVGAIVLLLIFAYGVSETIKFFSRKSQDNKTGEKNEQR